jgi:DNA-binding NarL/FixJ family response regulator
MQRNGDQVAAASDVERAALSRVGARILIGAATALYREGVLAALRDQDRFLVVAVAQDEREFVWHVIAERPDVVLVDVELLRAAAAQGLLPASDDGPRIVALAVADREEEISACADAGATEVVRRRADRDELLATIDRALLGDSMLPALRSALAPDRPETPAPEPPALTPREREILRLIEEGSTNKAIASALGCSQSTVKNHVHALLVKLGVNRRTQAARVARELYGLSTQRELTG